MGYVCSMSQITWSCKCFADTYGCFVPGIEKIVSYLPLSHIAGQASHNHLPKPNDNYGASSKLFLDTSLLRCWTCSFRSILVVQHILPSQMRSRCIVHTTAHTCVEGVLCDNNLLDTGFPCCDTEGGEPNYILWCPSVSMYHSRLHITKQYTVP